ncbi:MAG: SDR family NAD(P)-dependent oxidoreductase [Promethearchaeota archaeon]
MGKKNFMGLEKPGTAVITGASSGIGDEYARQLSEQGFDLVITARREKRLEALAKELKEKNSTNVEIIVADLADMKDIKKLAVKIKDIENLDCLINNAGMGTIENILNPNANMNIFLNMITLHCEAPMLLSHAALDVMMKRNQGIVMNTSSIASLILHGSHEPLYNSTKSFLSVFSEMVQLKLNFTKSKVKIKAICPGFVTTEMTALVDKSDTKRYSAWISPKEVVDCALGAYDTEDTIVIADDHFEQEVKDWRKVARTKPGRYFYF